MRKSPVRPALLLAVALVAPALPGPGLHAADAPRKAPAPLYDPQPLTLPGNRISLLDAIRITLQNDPNIKLREQDVLGSKGVWQTDTGRFDSSIQATAQYLFTQQALTLSQTAAEKKNRADLQKDIATEQGQVQTYQTQVNELTKLQADPTGYEITVADPKLTLVQARVDTFNQQIAAETDPAKQAALIAQRDAYIALNLAGSEADLAGAQAQVDQSTQQLNNLGAVPKEIQQQNLTLNIQALFPYRDGVTLGLVADGGYSSNRYKGKEKQAIYGGLGVEDQYTADVGFSISASLLRGRGRDATGAQEKASQINYEASELEYKHTASVSVLNTVAAYWNLVGAQDILEAARKSAGLQAQRLDVTDALISADEIPRSERARALASRASGDALVAAALRTVNEARVSLAVAMGVAVDSAANAPYAADPFPSAVERDVLETLSPAPLASLAFEHRYDRKAALKLVESGGVLLRKAETDLRPKLDVSGQITATGTAETSLSQMANGWTAPSVQAGLSFEKPVGNNTALGLFAQSKAQMAQEIINARDIERNIRANIVQILATLRDSADQVDRAREAVQAYAKTIESEHERYKSGETSLLDSILTQDYQTSAEVTYSQARQIYASLLARLRYETGTLLSETPGGTVVREDYFLHLPRLTKAP
jgi:outer membrane protein